MENFIKTSLPRELLALDYRPVDDLSHNACCAMPYIKMPNSCFPFTNSLSITFLQ